MPACHYIIVTIIIKLFMKNVQYGSLMSDGMSFLIILFIFSSMMAVVVPEAQTVLVMDLCSFDYIVPFLLF